MRVTQSEAVVVGQGFSEAKLCEFVAERYGGLIGSQILADILNSAKNARTLRNGKKFRRPERAMGAVLARDVPSSVHRYEGLAIDTPLTRRSVRLGRHVFCAHKPEASLDFSEISSCKPRPSWYSLGAGNFAQADADLQVVLGASIPNKAWEGMFCSASHDMMIQLLGEQECLVVLYHWADSAVLVWPAVLRLVPGLATERFVELQPSLKEPRLVTVTDIEAVKAMQFVWRSPLWQAQFFRKAPQAWCAAVRPFPVGSGAGSVLTVAASNAFWLVDKASLDRLARSRGVALSSGGSLCDTILVLVEKYAGVSGQEEALAIASTRLAKMRCAQSWTEGILEVDAAIECLGHHDHKAVEAEKKSVLDLRSELDEFRKDYRKKVSQVRSAPGGKPKESTNKKRGKKAESASSSAMPSRLPLVGTIAHGDAKRYAPPGSFVWRSVVAGAWQGHLRPYARVGRAWARYGEHEALRLVLADLWEKWLDSQGKERTECPIQGVFEVGLQVSDSGRAASRPQ